MVAVEIRGRLPLWFSRKKVQSLISAAYIAGGGEKDVSVSLAMIDDTTMLALNKQHRGKDKTTDILSFTLLDEGDFPATEEVPVLGELFISLPQVKRQAKQIGRTVAEEFSLMLVHGTLHLLGYDHEVQEEEDEMFGIQHDVLMNEGIL